MGIPGDVLPGRFDEKNYQILGGVHGKSVTASRRGIVIGVQLETFLTPATPGIGVQRWDASISSATRAP